MVEIPLKGGEPLILGEEIWGDDGIIKFASERGAAVNVNTNAIALTPEVALRLIKVGLTKLHISLDTSDRVLQNHLRGEHFDQILEGIYNVQLARDIIGTSYPVIHTNCVLTNRNLDLFPELFAFILEKHKQTTDKNDPFYNDLFPHVIPVGGSDNDWLRLSLIYHDSYLQGHSIHRYRCGKNSCSTEPCCLQRGYRHGVFSRNA